MIPEDALDSMGQDDLTTLCEGLIGVISQTEAIPELDNFTEQARTLLQEIMDAQPPKYSMTSTSVAERWVTVPHIYKAVGKNMSYSSNGIVQNYFSKTILNHWEPTDPKFLKTIETKSKKHRLEYDAIFEDNQKEVFAIREKAFRKALTRFENMLLGYQVALYEKKPFKVPSKVSWSNFSEFVKIIPRVKESEHPMLEYPTILLAANKYHKFLNNIFQLYVYKNYDEDNWRAHATFRLFANDEDIKEALTYMDIDRDNGERLFFIYRYHNTIDIPIFSLHDEALREDPAYESINIQQYSLYCNGKKNILELEVFYHILKDLAKNPTLKGFLTKTKMIEEE